jgi:hypothetical protein
MRGFFFSVPMLQSTMARSPFSIRRLARNAAILASLAGAQFAAGATTPLAPTSDGAGALRARYAELRPRLDRNDFGRPVSLDSRDEERVLKGDVHAVIEHAFGGVAAGLREAPSWCEVLILPFNTKHCTSEGGRTLSLYVGKKTDTPVEDAYRVDFAYRVVASGDDYLKVVLSADAGPMGTRNYRIVLEATPIDAGHTFLHLSYSYAYGTLSSLAMQTYLATTGASKVGFTVDTRDAGGQPVYVKGMRGVLERNTMRYFLAIEAYLNSMEGPQPARVEKRLNEWFSSSERYSRQLHEMGRVEYVAMKQREVRRLEAAKVAGG